MAESGPATTPGKLQVTLHLARRCRWTGTVYILLPARDLSTYEGFINAQSFLVDQLTALGQSARQEHKVIDQFRRKIVTGEPWVLVETGPSHAGANPRWIMAKKYPRGHFKYQEDLHLAYELLAYLLADVINLPITATSYLQYSDPQTQEIRRGTMAMEDEQHWGRWEEFELLPQFDKANYRLSVARLISNVSDLRNLLVFDTWIRNTDRHQGNILVSETASGGKRFKAIFIDHSHAFLWREARYQNEFLTELDDPGHQIETVFHPFFVALCQHIVTDGTQLEDVLARLQIVTNEEVEAIVDSVGSLMPDFAHQYGGMLKEGLKRRRDRIPGAVQSWCTRAGV